MQPFAASILLSATLSATFVRDVNLDLAVGAEEQLIQAHLRSKVVTVVVGKLCNRQ